MVRTFHAHSSQACYWVHEAQLEITFSFYQLSGLIKYALKTTRYSAIFSPTELTATSQK